MWCAKLDHHDVFKNIVAPLLMGFLSCHLLGAIIRELDFQKHWLSFSATPTKGINHLFEFL
jgi:hypothetical protein